MLHRRSATRWPARMLGLAITSAAALLFAAGPANAVTSPTGPGLTIGDAPALNPNPVATQEESDIPVSGIVGSISKVTATVTGFAHACPIDVDMLLVGPGGQKSLLMSDAGDCADDAISSTNPQPKRAGINLVFDDAGIPVPCLSSGTLTAPSPFT